MAFIGAEWVSPFNDHLNRSSLFDYQVSEVIGLMTVYYSYLTKIFLQIHILAKIRRTLRNGTSSTNTEN